MVSRTVLIIGGGAAGLTAAIVAARQGASVTLLERNAELGRKLLVTGNGRCNFSNIDLSTHHYRGGDQHAVRQTLAGFDLTRTLDFFASLGLHYSEENGRLYPRSQQGSTLRSVMLREIMHHPIRVLCSAQVSELYVQDGTWHVVLTRNGERLILQSDAVIVAIGGCSGPSPQHRSEGIQTPWLQTLGLPTRAARPALVPLLVDLPQTKQLVGARCPDCLLQLFINDTLAATSRGEIHWSRQGVSGIPLLDLSGYATAALQSKIRPLLRLDLLPELSLDELYRRLRPLVSLKREEQIIWLSGMVHERLSQLFLEMTKTEAPDRAPDPMQLARRLKQWDLSVSGSLDFTEAQIMAGGISLKAVNPSNLEVVAYPGLFLAGEILDVEGACGGYNLQWAWSSGYLAGLGASVFAGAGKGKQEKYSQRAKSMSNEVL